MNASFKQGSSFAALHTESQQSQIQLLCGRATGSTSALKKSCLDRNHIVLLCRAVVIADVCCLVPHIKECFVSQDPRLEVVLPAEVSDNCLFIDLQEAEKAFICDLPNKIERD